MPERRPTNSELRLRRLAQEDAAADDERGILELFDTGEPEPDEDAPLAREGDGEDEHQ